MYPLKEVGKCDINKTGTTVTFSPDGSIFEETVYDFDTLKQRLRETAFLTKNLRITLRDDREEPVKERVFHYEGGIKEFVTYLNKSKEALYPEVIYCEGEKTGFLLKLLCSITMHITKLRTALSITSSRRRVEHIWQVSVMRLPKLLMNMRGRIRF